VTTSGDDYRTIKVRAVTYDKMQKLLDRVSQDGWSVVGVERSEPVSLGGIVDEAVAALAARAEKRR